MCNIVDGGTEYAFLEKYIFYSNLNRHYAIMKHMDARDKEKEDSDEKNIVYHKRYSHLPSGFSWCVLWSVCGYKTVLWKMR